MNKNAGKFLLNLIMGIALVIGVHQLSQAQTNNQARDLFYDYTVNVQASVTVRPNRPPDRPNRPNRPTVTSEQNGGSNPTVKINKKPNKPTVINNSASGTKPTATGLPGTKVTIELMRGNKLSFVKPDYKFRSGDRIRLRLVTNFDGYVSIVNLGSTGQINLLYPYNGAEPRVRPSRDIQIPQSDWIKFDNNEGTEQLLIVMSKQPIDTEGLDRNSFSDSRDLSIEYAENATFVVCPEENLTNPVGFALKLKHARAK